MSRSRSRRPGFAGRVVVHVLVVLFMLVWFTPILGLLVSSLRPESDSARNGWWNAFLEPRFTTFNYRQALEMVGLTDNILTSLAIVIPTSAMTVTFSLLGAYALSRMRFTGRTVLSLVLVALLVTPPQLTLVPLLRVFGSIGLLGEIPAVWIYQVGFTVPFGIFLLRGFMAGIPKELFEAASIDGAGTMRVFRVIVLPLVAPAAATLALMQFLWSWNDLLIPLLFLSGSDLAQPITVQVAGLVSTTGQGEAMLMASAMIATIIPLILILSLQKYFVRGILGGAVKG